MAQAAFTGPLGAVALGLEPQSETCREALLFETILFFGSAIGRTAYFPVGRSRHYANEFGALVGPTSRARKGTVRDIAVDVVGAADPTWAQDSVIGGATSGEGIIAAVRDPHSRRRKATKKELADIDLTHQIDDDGYLVEEVDPGVGDKRRVFDEGELSAVFKVAIRDGNTLSERLRTFFDKGIGQIINKNSPMKATDAHVSINGHITLEELRARLTELDAANGWGNRFLYCATRRVQRLPGTTIADIDVERLAVPLGDAIAWAREHEPRLGWQRPAAWERWCAFYNSVPDDVLGLVGALTARSEAHVTRLALIYAVADRSELIELAHLEAALAVWDYCQRTVAWVWQGRIGNPDADRILDSLRGAGHTGLSRTSIRNLFSGDKTVAAIDEALALLTDRELAASRMISTGGRPAQWWWATEHFARPTGGTDPEKRVKSPSGPNDFDPFAPDSSPPGPSAKEEAEDPDVERAQQVIAKYNGTAIDDDRIASREEYSRRLAERQADAEEYAARHEQWEAEGRWQRNDKEGR